MIGLQERDRQLQCKNRNLHQLLKNEKDEVSCQLLQIKYKRIFKNNLWRPREPLKSKKEQFIHPLSNWYGGPLSTILYHIELRGQEPFTQSCFLGGSI